MHQILAIGSRAILRLYGLGVHRCVPLCVSSPVHTAVHGLPRSPFSVYALSIRFDFSIVAALGGVHLDSAGLANLRFASRMLLSYLHSRLSLHVALPL